MKKRLIYLILIVVLSWGAPAVLSAGGGLQNLPRELAVKLFSSLFAEDKPEEKPAVEPVKAGSQSEETRTEEDKNVQTAPRTSIEERLKGLEIPDDGWNWRRDWWKYALMVLTFGVGLALIAYFVKMLVRLLNAFICALAGALGSMLGVALLTSVVAEWLPPNCTWAAKGICGTLGFMIGYGIAGTAIQILRKPLRADLKKNDCDLSSMQHNTKGLGK